MSRIKIDLHCHTEYSFDSSADPDRICLSAIERGVTHLAITDHCDYDCILSGVYEPYLADKAQKTVAALKERYRGRLEVIYGIELGGAHAVAEEAEHLVKSYGYEFVLGSLHNLRGVPDFYFMNFAEMPDALIDSLVGRCVSELCEIAELPFVDSIAHVTYPLRYVRASGRLPDIGKYREDYTKLFKLIIKNGKALEVNTSPYRKGINDTMPERELLSLYKSLGGTKLTVGSDAHSEEEVGDGIETAIATLADIGFETVTLFDNNGERQIPIAEMM